MRFSRVAKYLIQKYTISMVSKNQIKLIASLQQKKHRNTEKLFIAEGVKVIHELLNSNFVLHQLYTTESDFNEISETKRSFITEGELKKMSALTASNSCLAVFKIPETKEINHKGLILALDDIRDPGNLGTILRLCDWFGVEELVCSHTTVDIYNPKVVQATMGSISRVNVNYVDLNLFLKATPLPVFGTFMNGKNIYTEKLPAQCIIIMGNEANGVSENIEKLVNVRLTIPRFGQLQQTESLNVANATAIVLSEFRRASLL
jgi:TrmH family RNA methyltransferase